LTGARKRWRQARKGETLNETILDGTKISSQIKNKLLSCHRIPYLFPKRHFDVYVEVNFLSQLIFKFTLFLGILMYADECETN